MWSGIASLTFAIADVAPPAYGRNLSCRYWHLHGTWKPRTPPSRKESEPQGKPMGFSAGLGRWKKRMSSCNGVDTGVNVTWHESEQTSIGVLRCEIIWRTDIRKESQMAVENSTGAPSVCFDDWNSIDWTKVYRHVHRLQMRIAKAVREGRWHKVTALRHLITRTTGSCK